MFTVRAGLYWIAVVLVSLSGTSVFGQTQADRIVLRDVVVIVAPDEASYVQYAAKDLASFLSQTAAKPVQVTAVVEPNGTQTTVIAIGASAAREVHALTPPANLGSQGAVIRSVRDGRTTVIEIAGSDPHGTNEGIATFLQMIQFSGPTAYVSGPLDITIHPSFKVRGFHLNGWPLRYPYAFRTWKEADWKRFIDIAWAQRVNLVFIWPFMEIIPVPLSAEDQAYLDEVHRVVDYAQKERGMQVWIMQSANRIGVSDCGSADPRLRTYWVLDQCQQDMNPADPAQFARIRASFQALYQHVNNADGYCMIDSDPGGWPHSPLSDQTKVFNAARQLLDQYSTNGAETKLIDWMWIGWGRVFEPSEENHEGTAVAFMAKTIQNFKDHLQEPWELIAGMAPYLKSAKEESVLDKTIFLQYGAIEMEPAFPATNLGQQSIQKVFDAAAEYPGLAGVMGNNELMELQFPRTYYFFASAWDPSYTKTPEHQVLLDISALLYPDEKDLIASCFEGLQMSDPDAIRQLAARLRSFINRGKPAHAGAIGRFLFPDPLAVARNLEFQLEIRAARQALVKALAGHPTQAECAALLKDYFDKLLSWNHETGWDRMIQIGIWRTPIYDEGHDLTDAIAQLRKVLANDHPYTSYSQVADFLQPIADELSRKYDRDSVMIGCIEPFKLALIQG